VRFVLPFAMLLASLPVFGQAKPNFTGTWKLNITESQYPNKDGMPTSLVRTVDHKGDSLRYKVEREFNGKKDGFDAEVTIGDANLEANIVAAWDGSVLVTTLTTAQGVKQIEHWKLAEGGKKISDQTVVRRTDGTETNILRVFDKQ